MLPGEFFVQTGKDIERRAGLEHVFVCAYANDYAGYLRPPTNSPARATKSGARASYPRRRR